MFDNSHLPTALHEFVVIADTHYMLDPTGQTVEFDSRRRQTARADYALRTVAGLVDGLGIEEVIHMGDLVQEFPERPGFAQAVEEALGQMTACGVAPRFVAGNHDVGDKPDPTMPADWVKPAYLDSFHRHAGTSWQSWDTAGLHFVILNSQILNSGLPAEQAQAAWLEDDLQRHAGERIFLFLHLPLFLHNPAERALGHYDNIDEPARSWLLELIQRHSIEMLFAAHIHWSFYNEIGPSRYFTVPSVAFTRPGFSQLFSSPPPPEQGRDDTGKLGFYLVRVLEEGSRVHFVRTSGTTGTPDPRPRLLTRTSPDLPDSPLGVVLHHPLANETETPSIWPSYVRQPVRNDCPLLACLEMGVRHLLVPISDLGDPLQQERLGMVKRQGVTVTARALWRPGLSLVSLCGESAAHCDGIQVDVLESVVPDPSLAEEVRAWKEQYDLPITLSCVLTGKAVSGKQHSRGQVGFLPGDLPALSGWLERHNLTVERVLCRMDLSAEGEPVGQQIAEAALAKRVEAVDWIAQLPASSTGRRTNGAAETLFALASQPGSRLFYEPFVELDRTMDVAEGMLDRLCNPHPVFHLLRHLNTLLYSQPFPQKATEEKTTPGGRLLTLRSGETAQHLLLPGTGQEFSLSGLGIDGGDEWSIYDLVSGRRVEKDLPGLRKPGRSGQKSVRFDAPILLVGPFVSA